MAGAGEYDTPLEWRKRAGRTADGFGQPADQFTGQGTLWAAVEDLVGGRASGKESEGQQTTATVRLRNYPGVAAGDRLYDAGRGELWTVDHVARDVNELRCGVSRPRWTDGGGAG